MCGAVLLLAPMLAIGAPRCSGTGDIGVPAEVVIRSGALALRGLLWLPGGSGPFPAVLFNHGRGCTPQPACDRREEAIRALGPDFASHGYVFLALFRRGEGLSFDQGTPVGASIEHERARRGIEAADLLQLRLLETEQLDDARAGLVFLRAEPRVDARRVALVGHSFGGSLSLLLAEQDAALSAVVAFAAAAYSWSQSPPLRGRLTIAVQRLDAPVLLVYAENDYSTAPGKALAAEMQRRGKIHRLVIFPPQGKTAEQAHDFVYRGAALWKPVVLEFIDRYLAR